MSQSSQGRRVRKKSPASQNQKTATKTTKKKPWPKCSKCPKDSWYMRRENGKKVHYCGTHFPLPKDRPKSKRKTVGLAPGKPKKRVVKRVKK